MTFDHPYRCTNNNQYEALVGRMDPGIKAKWVAALRDGSREQTKYLLHEAGGGFCCLGVYCDVMDVPFTEEVALIKAEQEDRAVEKLAYSYGNNGLRNISLIPTGFGIEMHDATSYSGFNDFHGGEVLFRCYAQGAAGVGFWLTSYTLPELNDKHDFTFNQIADIIDYFL